MGLFWYFMMNKQDGGGRGPMQFGRARAKLAQEQLKKAQAEAEKLKNQNKKT